MRMLLCPDWVFDDYTAVTPEFLRGLGVRLLLTDLDFTLAPKRVKDPDEQVRAWIKAMQEGGIGVVIISNNRNPLRVRRFCKTLGITYVGHAEKPLKHGYKHAMKKFSAAPHETAMIGDKLLTDTLGAKRCGIVMLMVEPAGGAVGPWQKVLHAMQEPFKAASEHDTRKK